MSEGLLIALAMILLFGFCFMYSYGAEYFIQKREERAYKLEQQQKEEKERQIKEKYAAKKAAREAFYQTLEERRQQIKRELEELQKFKQKLNNKSA